MSPTCSPDPAADPRIHLVEHERRDAIDARQNRFEREHDARQLAARRDARQRTRIVPDVERHEKLDIFGAGRGRGRAGHQARAELAVGEPELREERVDFRAQPPRAIASSHGELARGGGERVACGRVPLLELADVEGGRVHQIELGACGATGLEDIGHRGSVLLGEAEHDVTAAFDVGEPRRIEVDARRIVFEHAAELLERVVAVVEQLLEARERRVDALNRA